MAELGDRDEKKLRSNLSALAWAIDETRGRRGRDFIRGLEFGELMDDLDTQWQEAYRVKLRANRTPQCGMPNHVCDECCGHSSSELPEGE